MGRLGNVEDEGISVALDAVTSAAYRAGRWAGTFCGTPAQARRALEMDVDFVLTTLTICLAHGIQA
jgi:2-keto-3-deoxy-L-rhamnonate aldolase RhmA